MPRSTHPAPRSSRRRCGGRPRSPSGSPSAALCRSPAPQNSPGIARPGSLTTSTWRRENALAADARPRALVLAPEAPYPIAGGGALRAASLLHGLARSYEIDLIVFREPGAPDPHASIPPGLVQRISTIDLPANSRSFAARSLRNTLRLVRQVPPLVDRFSGFATQIA